MFFITFEEKERLAIGLDFLLVLGMGRILASFPTPGKVDLVSTALDKWIYYGKSLAVQTFKNQGCKLSESITFEFTAEIHSITSN